MVVSSETVGKGGAIIFLTFSFAMFELRFLIMLSSVIVPTSRFPLNTGI